MNKISFEFPKVSSRPKTPEDSSYKKVADTTLVKNVQSTFCKNSTFHNKFSFGFLPKKTVYMYVLLKQIFESNIRNGEEQGIVELILSSSVIFNSFYELEKKLKLISS